MILLKIALGIVVLLVIVLFTPKKVFDNILKWINDRPMSTIQVAKRMSEMDRLKKEIFHKQMELDEVVFKDETYMDRTKDYYYKSIPTLIEKGILVHSIKEVDDV